MSITERKEGKMSEQEVMKHKASISGNQVGSFGAIEARLQLDIWESNLNRLLVRLMKDGKAFATKTFPDCETQHSDSERWLNDEVRYPNPFAGILLTRSWE